MSETGAAKGGLMNIGEEAKPPFAILPDPSTLFLKRSLRFVELAAGHKLAGYLGFLADLTRVQHEIQADLPAAAQPASGLGAALTHGMPPLSAENLAGAPALAIFRAFLDGVSKLDLSAPTAAAVQALHAAIPDELAAQMHSVLTNSAPISDVAQHTLIYAALQVNASRLAGKLDADALKPIADSVCPACGSTVASSAVVGWPKAHNARFCICSLCSTHWNVVRVKCVLCSGTGGIAYHTMDGQSDAVKAETCGNCQHYVKINYQIHHPRLEGFADDVATLGLDLLMREQGWLRGGRNPFLLGY